jgi:hypothetical protein
MEVSKVAAPESTKFQVNFKTPDGTLINLYATSKEELEGLLTAASDFSALITSTSQAYAGAAPAAPVYASAPAVASAPSAGGEETVNDKYGNIWVYNHPSAPECSRGKMVLKHGKAQATGKPYKGWFDPATGPKWTGAKIPKDQQAATIWA